MTGMNTGATGLKTFAELYGTGYQPTGTPVSTPVLQNPPQAPAPNLPQDGQNSLEKSPKSDTITIAGKTIQKKTAIKAGLGALATAAVITIGVIAFRSRGKVPPEIKEANAAAEEMKNAAVELAGKAGELAEAAQKKIDAVVDLFKSGGKDADGKVVANIAAGTNPNEKIMEELAEDGTTVARRSLFTDDILTSIEEFLEGGKKNEINLIGGKLDTCSEGIEILSDGSETVSRYLSMNGDKPGQYAEGFKRTPAGDRQWDKLLRFDSFDGKEEIICLSLQRTEGADHSETTSKYISLQNNGSIRSYEENFEQKATREKTLGKFLDYKDGAPARYLENLEIESDGTQTFAKGFNLNSQGKWLPA